jgi:hypothetical protein
MSRVSAKAKRIAAAKGSACASREAGGKNRVRKNFRTLKRQTFRKSDGRSKRRKAAPGRKEKRSRDVAALKAGYGKIYRTLRGKIPQGQERTSRRSLSNVWRSNTPSDRRPTAGEARRTANLPQKNGEGKKAGKHAGEAKRKAVAPAGPRPRILLFL